MKHGQLAGKTESKDEQGKLLTRKQRKEVGRQIWSDHPGLDVVHQNAAGSLENQRFTQRSATVFHPINTADKTAITSLRAIVVQRGFTAVLELQGYSPQS
jgi:hypothetical protein